MIMNDVYCSFAMILEISSEEPVSSIMYVTVKKRYF